MKRFLLIFLTLSVFSSFAQQNGQSNQYIFNSLYINPATAGTREVPYITSFYRSQWTGVEGAPRSMSLAGDMMISNGRVGLGLVVGHDKVGAQSSLSAYANYAYRIQVGNSDHSRLSFGLAAGFIQQELDGRAFTPREQEDDFLTQGIESELIPDAKAGVFFTAEHFFAGFSVDNIIAQYASKKGRSLLLPLIKPNFYLNAGARLEVSQGTLFKPSFLVRDDARTPTTMDLNAFLQMQERFTVGCFYRTAIKTYHKNYLQNDLPKQNAIGLITELAATENIQIGYAFDYSLTSLQSYSYGSHEICLGIRLGRSRSKL